MRKTILAWAAGCALALSTGSFAVAADIVGSVVDSSGQAVRGSKISVADQSGQIAGNAITDQQGRYAINGLRDGQYNITLDAAGANAKGDTAVSYLGEKGLTVNWAVGPSREAIATAQVGTLQQTTVSTLSPIASSASAQTSPPGCKGQSGPPCGPKSPKN
jgi:hypothetical protein